MVRDYSGAGGCGSFQVLDAVDGCSVGLGAVLDAVDGCSGGLLVVLDAVDGCGEVECYAGVALDAGEGWLLGGKEGWLRARELAAWGISIALTDLPSFWSILRLVVSTLNIGMQSTSSSSESASK